MDPYQVNQKDAKGNTIMRIHDQLTDKDNKMVYSLYENENNKLDFWVAANSKYHKRIIEHRYVISQLIRLGEQLYEYDPKKFKIFGRLKKNFKSASNAPNPYNAIIANIISSSIVDQPIIPAQEQFNDLKNDFKSQIISRARFVYLNRCLRLATIVFSIALFFWLYESRIAGNGLLVHFSDSFLNSAYVAAAGAIGAFISVTLKISLVKIDPYLPDRRTILNAFIRIAIGMIFGLLLYWILKIDIVNILDPELFEDSGASGGKHFIASLIAGVIGGFSERLVPDILSKKAGEVEDKEKNEATQPQKGTESSAVPNDTPINGNTTTEKDANTDTSEQQKLTSENASKDKVETKSEVQNPKENTQQKDNSATENSKHTKGEI
ncbi:hypothetical protein ACJD0Z_08185 [Flavobacteriaceae bacterium M23B6Z8]